MQRAHLHHLLQVVAEEAQVHKAGLRTRDIEAPRTVQVNAVCRPGGQCPMPQLPEVAGPLVAVAGGHEDLFRFHIQKPQPHGAMPHDAFQVTGAAATAVALLGVQRDHHVARLPNSIIVRMAAVADAVAQVPHAHQLLHRFVSGGDARGQRVGVVDGDHRHIDTAGLQGGAQFAGDGQSLQLAEIGRFQNDAAADDAGETGAHALDGAFRRQGKDLVAQNRNEIARGDGAEIDFRRSGAGIHLHGPQFHALHNSRPELPRGQHSDAASHPPS